VEVALLDVAEVGLAEEPRRVADLREHLGHRHGLVWESAILDAEADRVDAGAPGELSGEYRGTAGRARRFRVHAGEQHAFFGHLVQTRRLVAANRLHGGNANRAERLVVPHEVDDIWRGVVLLTQLGQLLIDIAVLDRPLLSVLRFDDVVLSVVDDVGSP